MDDKLHALHALIAEKEPNICQLTVCRSGRKLCSDVWNGYGEDDCVHVMSVTKSVFALLVGIAIDRGEIGSVDDAVLSYFPDYPVKRGEKTIREVTIRHLLTMRAPYKCRSDPWTRVCSSENWTFASLDFLGGRSGLTGAFRYQTVCLHILSGLLYRATGMPTADYANRYLFRPLGIAPHRNYCVESAEEHRRFTLDRTPRENVWFADPQGLGTPGYGLCMSAGQMAGIGQLCLNKGLREGVRIVSSAWIEAMTAPARVEGDRFRGMHYGFLWWIPDPGRRIYAAIGNSGNVIWVNEPEQLVVAVSAYFKPTVVDRVDFIERHIVPALPD